MNIENERLLESEKLKREDFMKEEERRISNMTEKEHVKNGLDSRVGKQTSNSSNESNVNQDAESKQSSEEKNIKSTLKGNNNVNAQYKYVMDNLAKENERFHQSKNEETPAMKNYKALTKDASEGRKLLLERTKEKSLTMANPNQRGR